VSSHTNLKTCKLEWPLKVWHHSRVSRKSTFWLPFPAESKKTTLQISVKPLYLGEDFGCWKRK
jgi:hypothetical protein